MSAFRHIHNVRVRPLEEELAEMGLNPDKVLSEIERNTAMLEGGPVPLDLAGLKEGTEVPRSLAQYGSTLLDEKCKGGKGDCKGGKGDDEDEDDEDDEDEDEDEEKNGNGKMRRERKRDGSCKSKNGNGNGEDSEGMGESVNMEYILPEKRKTWSPKPGDNAVYVLDRKGGEHEADIENISRTDAKLVFENPMEFFSQFGRSFAHSGKKWVEWQSPGKVVKAKAWDTGRDHWAGASEMGHVRAAMASNDFDGKDPIEEDIPDDMALFTWGEIETIIAEAEKKAPLGSGERFSALSKELGKRPGVKDPKALAAWIGRKKYGPQKMAQMSAKGRKEDMDLARVRRLLGVAEGEKVSVAKLDEAISKLSEDSGLFSVLVLARRFAGDGISESLEVIEDDAISDALYLISEGWELDEVFQIVKKQRGAAARLAKRLRHRMYLMHRGEKKLAAKIFRKRFKRKIKRTQKRKEARFGAKGLSRLHAMGRRVIQKQPGAAKKEWLDTLSSIAEELERDTASVHGANVVEEAEEPFHIAVEVTLNAAKTAMYLGEVFDALGDEAGKVLFQLSDKAVDLAEAIEANGGEPTEEQEKHIETVLEAVIRALKEHEGAGSPSLGEAIGMAMVAEGKGSWEELVEYVPPSPAELQAKIAGKGKGAVQHGWEFPAGGTASPDPTIAGKYLKAINMAMQKMDPQAAIKAAMVVVKKHKVMDSKGLPVHRVDNMTDVLRVMFYLSQITGLKAPAWMYRGKQKPWFVTSDEAEDQTGKARATDKELATALKALGAPAGVLAALAAA